MSAKHLLYLAAASAALLSAVSCGNRSKTPTGSPNLATSPVEDVVAALTLDQKLHLIIGTNLDLVQKADGPIIGQHALFVPGAAGSTYAVPELGIPNTVLADGPAGVRISPTREGETRTYYCTYFPIGTLLASTWNQELIEEVGFCMGQETKEYGADVLLAPALNIQRNPLCGRNFEYYSEDPVIAGRTASAYIKGIQKNDVGTSIKHFAVNNQETNRKLTDALVSDRALREIYLKGFEIAIKDSKPWTVMSSYNFINGTATSESYPLLESILRDEWGYDGVVMSDWYSGNTGDAMLGAGNDMLQPGTKAQYDEIVAAIENGTLSMESVDKSVTRILQYIKRTPRFKGYQYSNEPDLAAHAQVTRQSSVEGMVLLKNDSSTLPLSSQVKNIALLGNTSFDFIAGGTGSGSVNSAYTVSLLDGLKNAGYNVDERLKEVYLAKKGEPRQNDILATVSLPEEMLPDTGTIEAMAQGNDIAVITLGRICGEGSDRLIEDFYLSDNERALLERTSEIFHAQGKKLVVILNIGNVIETESWKGLADAILLSWQAGQEGGNSVADLLSGKQSPSGRLAVSFPKDYYDLGSSSNFPVNPGIVTDRGTARTRRGMHVRNIDYTVYEEDIYVGYRWLQRQYIEPSYAFGYGLSYTTFSWSDPTVKVSRNAITATIKVTNTGDVASKDVVELYISAPEGGMDKPVMELKAYGKTKELAPGESQVVTLTVTPYDLASFNQQTMCWETAEGEYAALFGSDCNTIRQEVAFTIRKAQSWSAPTTLASQN